jgi:hypothetical protein
VRLTRHTAQERVQRELQLPSTSPSQSGPDGRRTRNVVRTHGSTVERTALLRPLHFRQLPTPALHYLKMGD